MTIDGRVEVLATRLDGVLMSGLSPEEEARSLLRLIDQHDAEIPPAAPMTFRLVAKDGEWHVHTAVPPHDVTEVTFTVGTPTP